MKIEPLLPVGRFRLTQAEAEPGLNASCGTIYVTESELQSCKEHATLGTLAELDNGGNKHSWN